MIINPIKKRREEKGLTQVELALLIGYPKCIFHSLRPGLIPSGSQTEKITEILGISQETLNKELYQFYEDRRKELKKRIERDQGNAEI